MALLLKASVEVRMAILNDYALAPPSVFNFLGWIVRGFFAWPKEIEGVLLDNKVSDKNLGHKLKQES